MNEGKAALFKAMAAVLGEVDRVPKSGENSFFHYRYATEADLMDMLRPILSKHGLALFVSVDGVEMREGGPQGQIARVGLDITIGCAEGGESITTRWYGEGQDKADKALYKAYTGAVKYFCFKTFLVSTGDDPEEETASRSAQSASGGQGGTARQVAVSQPPSQPAQQTQPQPEPVRPPQVLGPVRPRSDTPRPAANAGPLFCADCRQPITQIKTANGTVLTPADIANRTHSSFRRQLCYDCANKAADSVAKNAPDIDPVTGEMSGSEAVAESQDEF